MKNSSFQGFRKTVVFREGFPRTELYNRLGVGECFQSDVGAISGADESRHLLGIPCKQLDWQLSSMTQICSHLSSFLFRVEYIRISSIESPTEDSVPGEQWPELIRAFGSAKDFRLDGVLAQDIMWALHLADGGHATDTTVLPSLRDLGVLEHMHVNDPLWGAVQSFTASESQLLSGRRSINLELNTFCKTCTRVMSVLHDSKSSKDTL